MNAMPFVVATVAFFALAYRFYFSFVAAKVAVRNDLAVTPANRLYDGQNYYPMNRWVLFGHHFAAIAGAGPLVGPVLAAQFGFMPGFLWMLLGAVMAGSVHDFVILSASVQHDGKSLAFIAREEINKLSGTVTTFAIILIIIVAMAGLGVVVVNALSESSWGTFTIASTIPIALIMGLWMFRVRKGKTLEATVFGVIMLVLAVVAGSYVPGSHFASWFSFDHKTLTVIIAAYGFFASVLPVWLLLSPRDYLSSIMKISVIGLLAVGLIIVAPAIKMPAFTEFGRGGGPVIPGQALSVPFHYHSLRGDLRVSFPCEFGNDTKDDHEGIRYQDNRRRFHANGRSSKYNGSHRGNQPSSPRLFSDQCSR